MHELFYNWILKSVEAWSEKGITVEKIIDLREHSERSEFPYVSVHHASAFGLGEIFLHRVSTGYVIEFHAGSFAEDKNLAYLYEFSENPCFSLWQERYLDFLCS